MDNSMQYEMIFTDTPTVGHPQSGYAGFKPSTQILPAGYVHAKGAIPFPTKTIYQRDVAVKLRDGVTIYIDVYRPVDQEQVPALVCGGCSGKRGQWNQSMLKPHPGQNPEDMVPLVSGLHLFLGYDPAYWVQFGYAVVSVDSRGIYGSEGDAYYPGRNGGDDMYDVIEFVATQDWCTGKVGTGGIRWAGELQWFTAAARPPHLCAMVVWEAHGDLYGEEFARGGIPKEKGTGAGRVYNNGRFEDIDAMLELHPCRDAYWELHRCEYDQISIPALVMGDFASAYHTHGLLEGFRSMKSKQKWLHLFNYPHNNEVYYREEYTRGIVPFYDHFLRGIDNEWENTPKVRLLTYDFGGTNIENRPETEFPLSNQQLVRLYLDASTHTMQPVCPEIIATDSYDSRSEDDMVVFTYTFGEDVEFTGYSKLHLWVESEGADDMDIFIRVQKLAEDGTQLRSPDYEGPTSRLRVSHRELSPQSTETEPLHPHTSEQLLTPHEIVPVEIGLWPTSMLFHKGQKLRLIVEGTLKGIHIPPPGMGQFPVDKSISLSHNKGRHILHTGGQYDSYFVFPRIER